MACGGSNPTAETPKPHEETAEEKRSREYKALRDAEPKFPWVVDQTKAFQAGRECAQGPYRIEGKTLGAPIAEKVEVYICSPRLLSGREHFAMNDERSTTSDGEHFGYSKPENERCSATATEIANVGDAGAMTSTTSSSSATKSTGAHGVTAQAAPEKLTDASVVIGAADVCPKGTSKLTVIESSYAYGTTKDRAFHVDIWFPEPNDLRDATFVMRQFRAEANVTREQWRKLESDHDAWYASLSDFVKAHDDMFLHPDAGTSSPPPPARAETQPPKPSVHATWVPGYHHHDGATWVWIAGFWRVPEEDVKQELTTVAPTAPPPVRDESATRVAVVAPHDVIWTDGHWQWDGARWVWVDGAWRLPPERGVRWQVPTWRPRGGTFIFVPGGWARRR